MLMGGKTMGIMSYHAMKRSQQKAMTASTPLAYDVFGWFGRDDPFSS
jgi:hypothetical protein